MLDPTKTTMIRRKYMADTNRRVKKLIKDIRSIIVDDDVFGLKEDVHVFNVEKQVWRFQTNPQKIKSFRRWLKKQIDSGVLEIDGTGKPWNATYIENAYKKGMINTYAELHKADYIKEDFSFYRGGQEQFLRQSFTQPEVLSKVELLYERAFDELKGVTAAIDQKLSRTLADGLTAGNNPTVIARNISNTIKSINRTRALVIARTEIIRAHAEGQLDSFEILGVEDIKAMAEWSTAGAGVCELCFPLEGVIMSINEARGLIPRHPNCRCMWIPAFADMKEKGQKRGKTKTKAIKKSIAEERPNQTFKTAKQKSPWAGKEKL